MQSYSPVVPTAPDETLLFCSHFERGLWHWTYHTPRGRLLVRGAAHAQCWSAHRALLEAIADYCSGGEAAEEEEEEEPDWVAEPIKEPRVFAEANGGRQTTGDGL